MSRAVRRRFLTSALATDVTHRQTFSSHGVPEEVLRNRSPSRHPQTEEENTWQRSDAQTVKAMWSGEAMDAGWLELHAAFAMAAAR
jgi:hypothetical protein